MSSESADSTESSTSTSESSEDSFEDEDAKVQIIYAERKRNAGAVNVGVGLNEQSVLKDGYLLPAEGSDEEAEAQEETQAVTEAEEKGKRAGRGGKEEPERNEGAEKEAADGKEEKVKAEEPSPAQRRRALILASKPQEDRARRESLRDSARLHWEEDPDYPVAMVRSDPMQLEKAVMYYRSLPQAQSRQYHCLVNLACCLMSLNQHRLGKSLLEQATLLRPSRASAQLNFIACCLRIRHRSAALQAIDKALRNAEDLTAEDHRMLLWTRKELSSESSKTRKSEVKVRKPPARYQVFTRLEAWQMRKELLALRSSEAAEDVKPPWGRRHAYSVDSEQAIYSKKARWQPLTPEVLDVLRDACKRMGKYREADEAESDSIPDDTDDSDEEHHISRLTSKAAKQAYDCIKTLPCMQALASDTAVALLEAGDLVDYEAERQIFEEGDPALDVYIIVRGSVSIRVLTPELGSDPIPVQSLYDGQVFGDAKVAAWKDAEAPPPRRKAGARTQEETCMLRVPAAAYRQALGLDGKHTERSVDPVRSSEGDEEAALQPDVRRKVQALARSPLFDGATASSLVLLATNVQEVALRHDDVFVEIDQALQACFLISEGYVRVSVPAVDVEAKLSLEDVSRVIGMGRRPPKEAVRSRFEHLQSETGEVPVFQLGDRPLLLPPTSEIPRPVPRPSRLVGRKPGTPKRGATWQNSLRQHQVRPYLGAATGDIELCLLHAGEAFGLAALYDPRGECSYLSSAEIRVQSSEAKILVLTPGSLLYLNETLARSLVDKAKNQADPVAPSFQSIKRERLSRSKWTLRKQQVLHRLLVKED